MLADSGGYKGKIKRRFSLEGLTVDHKCIVRLNCSSRTE